MGWEDVSPSDAIEAASWIAGRLHPFGQNDVGSVIPTGFAAYARISDRSDALFDLLSSHTSTTSACWFCLWDGYGNLDSTGTAWRPLTPASPRESRKPRWSWRFSFRPSTTRAFPDRKRVQLPNRDYLLFKGTVVEAAGWMDGPNLWWPEDCAWCVASEIDLDYTLVGGSTEVVDQAVRLLGAVHTTVDDQT